MSSHRNPNGESLVSVFRRALAGELILPAIHLSNLVDRLRDGREASTVCTPRLPDQP